MAPRCKMQRYNDDCGTQYGANVRTHLQKYEHRNIKGTDDKLGETYRTKFTLAWLVSMGQGVIIWPKWGSGVTVCIGGVFHPSLDSAREKILLIM